ncbi:AGE family epimerase/isomerase [Phenylobacterium sp.]|uniref:AGE family epimerase/isomerase n=1 Tax=Phenylobacterium sp. TaxID=1871053 RepID=UPI002F427A41
MSGTKAIAHPASAAAARLHRWFMHHALPTWWSAGADPSGGYFDKLDEAGAPVDAPKRFRVQARQAHVYMLAARLGWSGPTRKAARHALDGMLALRGDDGLYRSPAGAGGEALDGMGLLYDQAFALLGLAAGRARFDEAALEADALALAQRLERFEHPLGGYAEAEGLAAPLFANPNMHLFESFQAWSRLSRDPLWTRLAAGQARLALERLIDPATGALGEKFAADWLKPANPADRYVWPGHLYEWGFLLLDWPEADAASRAAALKLIEVAERRGVDADGFVIFALDERLAPLDRGARLWAQTERIRACARAAALTGDGALWQAAAQACGALEAFLQTPTPGLWRDWRDEAGAFRQEPAPASSLYHIAGAIAEVARLA